MMRQSRAAILDALVTAAPSPEPSDTEPESEPPSDHVMASTSAPPAFTELSQKVLAANKDHQYALRVYTERLEAELETVDKLLVSESNALYFIVSETL